jgi:hypothetical protein
MLTSLHVSLAVLYKTKHIHSTDADHFFLSFSSEIIENRKLFLLQMFLSVDSSMESMWL